MKSEITKEDIENNLELNRGWKILVDKFYLIIYGTIFIISLLMAFGIQNVTMITLPEWNTVYTLVNIAISAMSLMAIVQVVYGIRWHTFEFIIFLLILLVSLAVIESFLLLIFPQDYTSMLIHSEIVYRLSFNIFMSIMIGFRILFINKSIEEGL